MAHDARHPIADLNAAPEDMGFFELLRRMERPGQRFGRAGGPSREPARLGQGVRLGMATRDVARVAGSELGRPPQVDVELIGLLGPEGPMPLHLTRWVHERVSQRWFAPGDEHATADTAFLDLCNLLQHRMVAFFWRAWADARPAVQLEREGAGRIGATLAALAGIGLPGLRPEAGPARDVEAVKLVHAMRIAAWVQGPERLTVPLADLLGAPVRLVEFVGGWIEIPPALRTRLGRTHARLGQGAVAGMRVFSRQDRAELRVGPVGLGAYLRLADDRPLRDRLRHLVLHLVGREVDVDLRPVLAATEVPQPRLGRVALGRTLWLPSPEARDRDDLRLPRVTREPLEAAA